MNSCFEKFVGFKRIVSDGLNRILALKNSIKVAQKNVVFFISSNYMHTGVTSNLPMRQKNLLWKR